jgi:hypothetical protein
VADIEFAPLPADRRTAAGGRGATGDGKFAEVRAALRSRPGEWARIDTKPHPQQPSRLKKAPAWQGFELVVRKGDNGWDTWARYVAHDDDVISVSLDRGACVAWDGSNPLDGGAA